ncbi:MAG: zinc-ribbon domain containing protein [Candidatus Rokubacteria bacterium]|nr:zinc-ribbon domain containing protein [Candidatus Rokubacteria bacterium]
MDAQDKVLLCKECGKEFLFSAGEQAFYAEKGFQHEPTRCRNCRAARKGRSAEVMSFASNRSLYAATCSECGKETQVPFRPTPGKPVFCRDCFQKRGTKAPSRRSPAYLEP